MRRPSFCSQTQHVERTFSNSRISCWNPMHTHAPLSIPTKAQDCVCLGFARTAGYRLSEQALICFV